MSARTEQQTAPKGAKKTKPAKSGEQTRRSPARQFNQERLALLILAPVVSEKGTFIADKHEQVIFKVMPDATKPEVKAAVEAMFKVEVDSVQIVNVGGKTKRFGRTLALDDVSFDVPMGSIFGLLGPNGAGKTTLFSIAAGFLRADSGSLRVLATDIEHIADLQGRMTILPQDAAFQKNVPIMEQLMFLRRLDGTQPDRLDPRQDHVGAARHLEAGQEQAADQLGPAVLQAMIVRVDREHGSPRPGAAGGNLDRPRRGSPQGPEAGDLVQTGSYCTPQNKRQ